MVDFDVKEFLQRGRSPRLGLERMIVRYLSHVPALVADSSLAYIVDKSKKDPHAWDMAICAYNLIRKRGEALPSSLQRWTDDVVNGRLSEPSRPAHRPPNHDRADLYLMAVEILMHIGEAKSEYAARKIICEATDEADEKIKEILKRGRKYRDFHP